MSEWSGGNLKFDPVRKALSILGGILFVLWIGVYILPLFKNIEWLQNLTVSRRPLFLSTLIFTGLSSLFFMANKLPSLKLPLIVLIFTVHIFELNYAFQKFNPFVKTDFIFPTVSVITELKRISGFDRYWGYGNAAIDSNFASQYSLYATDGYDPLYPKIYGQLIHSSGDGRIPKQFTGLTRSDAYLSRESGDNNLGKNRYRSRLLDILGIRYILDLTDNGATEKIFPPNRFSEVYSDNTWKIIENRQAVPRVYIVTKTDTYETPEEFEEKFYDPDFNPYNTVLLDKNLPDPMDYSGSTPSAYLALYEPENIIIRTSSDGNGMLVLSDTFYPGWTADIDGSKTPIYRANFSFRAIYLPKGSHTVSFRYKPASVTAAEYITELSIIIMVSWIVFNNRKYNKKPEM
jgi:hypothetical protein